MLVQISDCHVTREDEAAITALKDTIAGIAALPVAPAALLVSGDIVHERGPSDYELVRDLLATLGVPVYAIPGNHDNPALVYEAFGKPGDAEVSGLRLVLCDTHLPGTDGGSLDVDDLARRLAGDDRPTIVAMHHPPLRTGIPVLDRIVLPATERTALGELLAASPQVLRVVCGHVHRLTFETLGGCGVFTCPATHLQIEPVRGPEPFAWVPRGRGFAMHSWLGGALVTQVQPV